MFLRLFLLFTLVPVLELYILVKLGTIFGVGLTLLVVIGTGILGATLSKREGLKVWFRIQEEMQNGRFPGNELLDGFLIFIAGVLLLTPGLLTDILGFLTLIPWTRAIFKKWIKEKVRKMMDSGHTEFIHFIR
ncbi:MAG: membrane protein FxsA [Nitrospirae bacterium]|nr:membrane protein FxsA [Nitrospirota bacterium]